MSNEKEYNRISISSIDIDLQIKGQNYAKRNKMTFGKLLVILLERELKEKTLVK